MAKTIWPTFRVRSSHGDFHAGSFDDDPEIPVIIKVTGSPLDHTLKLKNSVSSLKEEEVLAFCQIVDEEEILAALGG